MKIASVTIPTKNRPNQLRRCLESIYLQKDIEEFEIAVCDSTDKPELIDDIEQICRDFPHVKLLRHNGINVAAARNACIRAASTDIVINVDDDIYLEPDALRTLLDAYLSSSGYRVVAGSVKWQDWSRPIKMRLIGYGRAIREGEKPDFLVGAFFAYPRRLGVLKPWNENIRTSDDRFMGALWRALGVELQFCPAARAVHDYEVVKYGVAHQSSHIYVNLFDSVLANRNLVRIVSYEVLGFLWGVKAAVRINGGTMQFIKFWIQGHRAFARDFRYLSALVSQRLPPFSSNSSRDVV